MTPVIPATACNVPLIPGIAFSIRRNNCSTRCSSTRKWVKSTSLSQPCVLPLSNSLKLFPHFSRGCFLNDKSRIIQISATGTDVAVEEQDFLGADEVSGGKSEAPSSTVDTTNEAPAKSGDSTPPAQQKRARPSRKSEMPPVKNEELIPGATFTGKIRSIQPFGAFVDFGAFTDGLVHVSQLSDSFVKDVGTFVSVGQEVKVRLLEANTETGRISLTMRESDDGNKKQQQKDALSSADRPRPSTKTSPKSGQKRNEIKKTSKFVKGQDLDGTVKNITRSGSFISLPEGEEGFLPSSEESDEGFVNMMGGSSLQIGQEVKVRVLRINRGQVTLTMKKEEDNKELDLQLSQGVVHTATNPFVLAFRKNKDIAAFLDQKVKVEKSETADRKPVTLTTSEEAEGKSDKRDTVSDVSEQVGQLTDNVEAATTVPSSTNEEAIEAARKVDDGSTDTKKGDEQIASMLSNTSGAVLNEVQTKEKEAKGSSEIESTLLRTSEAVVDEVKTEENKAKRSAEAESALSTTSKAVDVEVQTEEKQAKESSEVESTLLSTSEAVVDEVKTEEKKTKRGAKAEIALSSTSKAADVDVQTEEKEVEAGAEAENAFSSTSETLVDEVQTEEIEPEQNAEAESILSSTSEALDDVQTEEKEDEQTAETESTLSGTSEAVVGTAQTKEEDAEGSSEAEKTLSSTSEAVVDEVKTDEKEAGVGTEAESTLSSTSEAVVDEVQIAEKEAEETAEAESKLSSTPEAAVDEVQIAEKEDEETAEAESKLSSTPEAVIDEVQSEEKEAKQTAVLESMLSSTSEAAVDEAQTKEEEAEGSSDSESKSSSTSEVIVGEVQTEGKKTDGTSETLTPEENEPSNNVIVEEVCPKDKPGAARLEASPETSSQISSSESLTGNGMVESESDAIIEKSEELTKPLAVEDEIPAAAAVEGDSEKPSTEKSKSITSSTEKFEDTPSEEVKAEEPKPIAESQTIEETSEEQISSAKSEAEIPSVSPAEVPSAGEIKNENGTPAAEGNGSVSSSNGKAAPAPEKSKTKASVSPALVKQLREETGAGMMDCKKALAETGGDIVKAQEFLRKKGLASAEKKASRVTAEGRIGSYIHDSRIGVLVEVNCETDFVSRGEIFKELVDDLAMQVAACPQVQHLVPEDVPKDFVSKEREIEMQKEDLQSKPEQIRSKIVEGRIKKRLDELALLEQPYIKNDKVVVKDFVKQTIATIGENIKVKRFVRFNLGEGLEKKSQDFAAEVAAQTAAKAPAPPKKEPAPAETTETVKKPPTVAVSAALVKQLREETGAGMMDCKKALSETGGDLEKAQEYLRKKGLSSADKKSSRLAAEGRIGSYIHDSRIGVLIEVNCETDFVGRSERFKELVDDLAMQVVACPQVQFVSIEDISEDIVKTERAIEMQREDLQSKPENIREKIVEGRLKKRLGELALLEQPFIKDDSILVKDLVKQTVAALGENIKVRRFVKFTLGETNENAN